MKNYNTIKNCRTCNSKKLDTIFSLAEIPIPESYEKKISIAKNKKRFPQTITRCKNCKHIQIKETINQKNHWNK